ncbi:Aldehyde/histidinol dehydrogenase [Lipomyces tetrasporus]
MLASFPEVSVYRWSCDDPSRGFAVENPATGKVITMAQARNVETAHAAIQASQEAFAAWQGRSRQERCTNLMQAADEFEKYADDLALLRCLEIGKPHKDAVLDVLFLGQVCRYFGSIGDKLPSEFLNQGMAASVEE